MASDNPLDNRGFVMGHEIHSRRLGVILGSRCTWTLEPNIEPFETIKKLVRNKYLEHIEKYRNDPKKYKQLRESHEAEKPTAELCKFIYDECKEQGIKFFCREDVDDKGKVLAVPVNAWKDLKFVKVVRGLAFEKLKSPMSGILKSIQEDQSGDISQQLEHNEAAAAPLQPMNSQKLPAPQQLAKPPPQPTEEQKPPAQQAAAMPLPPPAVANTDEHLRQIHPMDNAMEADSLAGFSALFDQNLDPFDQNLDVLAAVDWGSIGSLDNNDVTREIFDYESASSNQNGPLHQEENSQDKKRSAQDSPRVNVVAERQVWTIKNIRERLKQLVRDYDDDEFQASLNFLEQDMGNNDPEEWARSVCERLRTGDPHAQRINKARKVCISMLYKLFPDDMFGQSVNHSDHERLEDLICDVFQKHRITTILGPCLILNRMYALVRLKPPGETGYGMHWFSDLHFDLHYSCAQLHPEVQDWKNQFLTNYPGDATMNKRLFWLLFSKKLNLQAYSNFAKWSKPQEVDTYRGN